MTQYIDVVGTEAYYNNWSSSDPETKGYDMTYWCDDVWADFIENGSGTYAATYTFYGQSTVEIPESALCDCYEISCCTLASRKADADEWLQNNYSYYDSAAAVLVLDHYGQDDGTIGNAWLGNAGDSTQKTGIIDMSYEDNGNMDYGYFSQVKSKGTVQHELGHLYDARHSDGTIYASNEASILCPAGGKDTLCNDDGSPDVRIRSHTTCEANAIQNHID